MHFSIHVTRSFTLPDGSLYSYYIHDREKKKKLEMICDIFLYLEFQSNIIISDLSTCVYKCNPAFLFFQKNKEQNPFLA